MYIPSQLPRDFWQKISSGVNNVRLMVKRVFITDDLGEDFMPRWLSFLKVIVDADDLPYVLPRSRELLLLIHPLVSTYLEKPSRTTASSSNFNVS